MPKIRQRKQPQQQHPSYLAGQERDWTDDERERNGAKVRRNFIAILAIVVVLLVVLVVSVITGSLGTSEPVSQITAADTFSITQAEQGEMAEKAREFAEGLLIFAYCSDDEEALNGKNIALSYIPSNSSLYDKIVGLSDRNPVVDPGNLAPIVTEPQLQNPTKAYADTFSYEFSGTVADMSLTDGDTQGVFIDKGWHFAVRFSHVVDEATGEYTWVITAADITQK